jgi:hypothetical protein
LRVLTATGLEELDRDISAGLSGRGKDTAGECYYREGLLSLAKGRGADVVVLSPHLPGQADTVELVKELRMAGLRVILLPGRRDDKKAVDLARKAVALGVYDLVWDPVSPEAVVHRVLNPATLAEAGLEPDEAAVGEVAVQDIPGESRREKTGLAHAVLRFLGKSRTGEATLKPCNASCDSEGQIEKALFLAEQEDECCALSSADKSEGEQVTGGSTGSNPTAASESNFYYEMTPYMKDSEKRKPEKIPDSSVKNGGEPGVKVFCKTLSVVGATLIAVASPVSSGGATTFTVHLARRLAEKKRVSAFDCDLSGKGLGVRFNIRDSKLRDWRKGGLPADAGGVTVYPLEPTCGETVDESRLFRALAGAACGADCLVVDLGSDLESWWFRYVLRMASVVFWVVRNDPLVLERARSRWTNRPRAVCREFLILYGSGNPREMEAMFLLPCLQVEKKKSMKQVVELLEGNLSRGPRVLVVGFKEVPEHGELVCDVFDSVEAAGAWIESNVPDIALLSEDLDDLPLIEFDLKKLGVPVIKTKEIDLRRHLRELEKGGSTWRG